MSSQNLMNFWRSIRRDQLLLSILLIGLVLRGLNPTFGSPSLYVSNDEAIAHLSAFNMIIKKTPISIANYTPLGAYVQLPFLVASFLIMKILGLVSNAGDFELFVLTHEGYFLFIPRLISAFFGTLTVLLIYKMTFKLFKHKQTALISAFFAAVSFNLVHISHFGRPWAAALFFFLLAIYLSIKNSFTFSYITVGISYGFHQVGILAIPLIVRFTKKRLQVGKLLNITILILMIIILSSLTLKIGVIKSIGQGQSFLKPDTIITDLLKGENNLFNLLSKTVLNNSLIHFFLNLLITDGVIIIFTILGIFISFKQRLRRKIIYYVLGYFLFAVLFFYSLPRYLLPIFLISIPFAAHGITNIFPKSKIIIAILLAISSVNSLWWNYLYLQKPTFILASEWIEKNVVSGEKIANVGGRFTTFAPDKSSIDYLQKFNPNSYRRLSEKVELMTEDNTRNILYLNQIPNAKDNLFYYITDYSPTYLMNYYFTKRDSLILKYPNFFEEVVVFNPSRGGRDEEIAETLFDPSSNFDTYDIRTHPSMYSLEKMGPIVEILKFKN